MSDGSEFIHRVSVYLSGLPLSGITGQLNATLMWWACGLLGLGVLLMLGGRLHGTIAGTLEKARYGHVLIDVHGSIGLDRMKSKLALRGMFYNTLMAAVFMVAWACLIPMYPWEAQNHLIQDGRWLVLFWLQYRAARFLIKAVRDLCRAGGPAWRHQYLEGKGLCFITADDGERYRVTHWGRDGHYLYDPDGYEKRKIAEVEVLKAYGPARYLNFVKFLAVAAPAVALYVYVRPISEWMGRTMEFGNYNVPYGLVTLLLALFVVGKYGVRFGCHFLFSVLDYWGYHHYQYEHGAVLREAKPVRKGRQFTEARSAHGTAQFADGRTAARKLAR